MTLISKELIEVENSVSANVLQIISANAISRNLFFTRGFSLEIEISITFLYDKQF